MINNRMQKKKIAIIIEDSIFNRKGMMNAELNRITHLSKISDYDIDVYSFQTYFGWLFRKIKGLPKVKHPKEVELDGIKINVKWRKFSIIDYVLMNILHKSPFINKNWQFRYIKNFKGYDIIVANSTNSGRLALEIKRRYGIPYYVTWHGTDIHSAPFDSSYEFHMTKIVMEGAELNFMVSQALLETSKKISETANRIVLYNGVNSSFHRYSDSVRLKLRREKGVESKKVVAFAGHLIEVKNPHLFPEIFRAVNEKYIGSIEFWIMGTGKWGDYIKKKCAEYLVPLKMWGNVNSQQMPSMLNCVDVLILPSRNEGLPLIAVEAIACGANAVGAKVGGIPEVMGEENTFNHGEKFLDEISDRIVYMLSNEVYQPLKPYFSWAETAKIENNIYKSLK